MRTIIQTRKDLDAIKGTPEYKEFIKLLVGSMTKKVSNTVYPIGYDQKLQLNDPGYIPTTFNEIEDLTEITRFGFTKEEILALSNSL